MLFAVDYIKIKTYNILERSKDVYILLYSYFML